MLSTEVSENKSPETASPDLSDASETSGEETRPLTLAQALLGSEPATPRESAKKAESNEDTQSETDSLPRGLHALAERLGVKPEDLYAIEVPMADGTSVKLGELKDAYADRENTVRKELELEERRIKIEAELTRAKSEIETLIKELPPEALKPEFLERVRKDALAARERERRAIMEAIPEWADEKTRTSELQGIVEMLQDYGYSPQYLEQSLDSRLIRLARDSWLRKTRIERALAAVKRVEPVSMGKSRKVPPRDTRRASSLGNRAGNLRTLLSED